MSLQQDWLQLVLHPVSVRLVEKVLNSLSCCFFTFVSWDVCALLAASPEETWSNTGGWLCLV